MTKDFRKIYLSNEGSYNKIILFGVFKTGHNEMTKM